MQHQSLLYNYGHTQHRTLNARLEALSELREDLRDKIVLIAGQFPPRLVGELVASTDLTQFDEPDMYGFAPVHFYHLARYGLRGVTNLQDIIGRQFDVIIAHGAKANSSVYVSLIVPKLLDIFPKAQRQMLESDHRLPQMLISIPAKGFKFIPHFLS